MEGCLELCPDPVRLSLAGVGWSVANDDNRNSLQRGEKQRVRGRCQRQVEQDEEDEVRRGESEPTEPLPLYPVSGLKRNKAFVPQHLRQSSPCKSARVAPTGSSRHVGSWVGRSNPSRVWYFHVSVTIWALIASLLRIIWFCARARP